MRDKAQVVFNKLVSRGIVAGFHSFKTFSFFFFGERLGKGAASADVKYKKADVLSEHSKNIKHKNSPRPMFIPRSGNFCLYIQKTCQYTVFEL
jgi:hypothetical protein